jgi:deoxycytidylate deaminase
MDFRQDSTDPSELIIGVVGPIGCNRKLITDSMSTLAKHYSYKVVVISMSKLIQKYAKVNAPEDDQYVRVSNLINAGNELRKKTADNALLAKLAAIAIAEAREKTPHARTIYIIDSIKHPQEIDELRHIYGLGFFLFAVHSSQQRRDIFLMNDCLVAIKDQRDELIARDADEQIGYGQSTSEAFHMADFFLTEEGNNIKVWNTLKRFFDLIFGHPFKTPTFHEYAMFTAYGASMRSSDMSRQVGAVLTKETDILSFGANETPRAFGGTYWPIYDGEKGLVTDIVGGRDYTRGVDRNAEEKHKIVEAIKAGMPSEVLGMLSENIERSGINDLTEYGRVVHAEMDALLSCARRGISCEKSTLFCTTFPCHNCAKHIVAAGTKTVVYIEPYPKSKAYQMHDDAIASPDDNSNGRVLFTPFVGVGPRQFVNLFSMSLSAGARVRRKKTGSFNRSEWIRKEALPRLKMFPLSYRENEQAVRDVEAKLAAIDPVAFLN